MEDRHNYITALPKDAPQPIQSLSPELSFFAVYDGHSGDSCADFLSKNLFKLVLTEESRAENVSVNSLLSSDERIKSGFMKTDAAFEKAGEGVDDSGTTAVTTFVKKIGDKIEIICANTGDSRCVLFNEGKTEPMSYDHKPTNQLERDRIQRAGSFVEFSRVNGSLAVSRAFGDLSYKKSLKVSPEEQAVTALPDIKRVQISGEKSKRKDYSFLILACDGIWDVMSNEDATKFVRDRLIKQRDGKYIPSSASTDSEFDDAVQPKSYKNGEYDLGAICEDMLDYCVKCLDSKDNVSVVIVLFE